MIMRIDANTKYVDFFGYENALTDDALKALRQGAQMAYKSYYSLTIREMFACMHGDFSLVGLEIGKEEELTAFAGVWITGFKDWIEEFIKTLKGLQPPQTLENQQAAAKCIKVEFEESVLVFCREYFNLQSFDAVYDLSVSDFLIAKKDAYNKAIFERTLSQLMTKKYNSK